MNIITIIIGIPHTILNPNNEPRTARGHKGKSAEARKQKDSAYLCALSAMSGCDAPRWEEAVINARAYWPNKRNMGRRDRDNFIGSLKRAMDGIAEAGVVKNDSGFHWGAIELDRIDPAFPRVELTIIASAALGHHVAYTPDTFPEATL